MSTLPNRFLLDSGGRRIINRQHAGFFRLNERQLITRPTPVVANSAELQVQCVHCGHLWPEQIIIADAPLATWGECCNWGFYNDQSLFYRYNGSSYELAGQMMNRLGDVDNPYYFFSSTDISATRDRYENHPALECYDYVRSDQITRIDVQALWQLSYPPPVNMFILFVHIHDDGGILYSMRWRASSMNSCQLVQQLQTGLVLQPYEQDRLPSYPCLLFEDGPVTLVAV